MATPTIDWIGKRVRLSADLRDASGDPHLQAGKEGLVLSQAENGSLVVDCEGSHAVVKPADLVEITTGGWEGIHTTSTMIKKVKVRDIQPSPFNPRQHYPEAEMSKLAASIREVGVMQPVLLRPITMPLDEATITHYELVFGHRRFRGAQLAGLAEVPAMVRKLTDLQSAQLQAVENLQREDLDAIEEAQGFAAYIEAHSITKDQLAVQLGISRTLVYNRLKLATLGPAAAAAYRAKKIGAEVATLIARVEGEKNQAKALQVRTRLGIDPGAYCDRAAAAFTPRAVQDIAAERVRQMLAEGWTYEHDDEHVQGEIAALAAYYAMPPAARDWPAAETGYGNTFGKAIVPCGWEPKGNDDRRRELVKAGALICAELERLDRAKAPGARKEERE